MKNGEKRDWLSEVHGAGPAQPVRITDSESQTQQVPPTDSSKPDDAPPISKRRLGNWDLGGNE